MGPERKRYWLPLVRLSAFFCAVVVSGNLLFQSLYTPPADAPRVGRNRDFLNHKKRQLKRHYLKFRRFLHGLTGEQRQEPVSKTSPAKPPAVMMMAAEEAWVPQEAEVAVAAEASATPTTRGTSRAAMQLEGPLYVPLADPDPVAFVWPEPLPPLPTRTVDLMRAPSELHLPVITPEVLNEWNDYGASPPLIGLGDGLLKIPELLFDGVLALAGELASRPEEVVWTRDDDGGSLTDRLLDFTIEPRQGHIFSEFAGHWMEQEQRYFAGFEDSDLNTASVQDGREDVNLTELKEDQTKLLWDALRKTYFSKYKFRAEKTIKDDAFYFNQWRGVDFLLLPPLMTGYVYYRGIEKNFSIKGTRVRVELEPLSKWKSEDTQISAASLFWTPTKSFPIGVIVSAGLYDGDPEMDFIGIGTSASMARRAIRLQRGE